MSMLKKNVRIQLFNKDGIVSDRMVTQATEFYLGPKEIQESEFRIEFTITEKSDAEGAITYLKQLMGDLPIKTVKGKPGRKESTNDNDENFAADKNQFISDLLNENAGNQDALIKALRDVGYVFVTSDYLKMILPESYKLKAVHLDNYEWLIRRTKLAKDIKNDKYDPQILVGVKIMNGRSDNTLVYTYGEFSSRFKIPVPEKKQLKLSKTNLIKFPHYMEEDERLKWGNEHRALFNITEKKPSKFYMRWFKDVVVGDELRITLEDLNERLYGKK